MTLKSPLLHLLLPFFTDSQYYAELLEMQALEARLLEVECRPNDNTSPTYLILEV